MDVNPSNSELRQADAALITESTILEAKRPNAGNTLYGLQTLRFIAASMVVLAHVGDVLAKHGAHCFDGWIGGAGVDIFFVISGYIMARLSDGPITGLSVASEFLSRRLSRIVPIYWLVTLVILALWTATGADMLTGLRVDNVLARTVKSLLFSPSPVVVVGWTLTYEMAFYVIIAASLALSLRREIRFVIVATVLLATALGFVATAVPADPVTWPRSAMITEFVVGMAIYLLTQNRVFSGSLALSSILFGGFCLWTVRHNHAINHGHPIWVAGAAAITFGFISAERIIRWPKLGVQLGDASYSVYLIHLYVVLFLDKILWKTLIAVTGNFIAASAFTVIALVLSATASIVICGMVERPLTKFFQNRLVAASRRIFSSAGLTK